MEIGGAKSFGKRIKAGTSCNGCGLCSKRCPTANISMQNATPVFGKKCLLCLQCIYQCPNGSLVPGIGKFMVLQEGFDLQKIQATLPLDEPVDIDVEASGLLWFGVRRYLQDTHDI
ncbi:MAG: 4Fe-4S dicluster domain-containing protein [Sphaerochaeta sp.]|nr:4Fe-4S dicluster domain-containing protein [Sphaerochaeta sp.]